MKTRAGHEWTLAVLAGVGLALVMTWPALRDPWHTLPHDLGDPAVQAWQLAWIGHALTTDPAQLWNTNAFHPEPGTLAYSDSLLGYAPVAMVGSGIGAAVLRYNILYALAHALSFIGAYALVRQLGSGRFGAALAGVAFAYAPWTLAHAGHLNIVSAGGIPLALAMLARGHGWSLRHPRRPPRPGWIVAGWAVATWQLTLGFAIGLPFAYVMGVVAVVCLVASRRDTRLMAVNASMAIGFGAVAWLMAQPYLRVLARLPEARRTPEQVELYSVPANGLLTAPGESLLWGHAQAEARSDLAWPAEMALLPGVVLLGLALAGLVWSIWTVRQRILIAAAVVASAVLATGTGPYRLVYHLPGWDGLRAPGRLILWTTLLLGVLAAGALTAMAGQVASMVAVTAVLAEGLSVMPHPTVPAPPPAMRAVPGPVLVLPAGTADGLTVLWSTDGFPRLANGMSGVTPSSQLRIRQAAESFPDPASIRDLRELGVRTVIWMPPGSKVVIFPL